MQCVRSASEKVISYIASVTPPTERASDKYIELTAAADFS